MKKSLKRIIGEIYVKYRIRIGRGATFTSEITSILNSIQQGGILVLLLNQYTHWLMPIWFIAFLWVFKQGLEYLMGWYDQEHLHWQQFENQFTSSQLNPWNDELMRKIDNLQEDLNKLRGYTNKPK